MSSMCPFPTCTPEEAGVPSAAVEAYLRAVNEKDLCIHSLLLMRNNTCFHESYWRPIDCQFQHRLYSCSKTFVAVAVGLAIEQGFFTLNSRAVEFFPDYTGDDLHPYLSQMTIRDLLCMASCWSTGSSYTPKDPDWVQTFFDEPVTHVPGTIFQYCTAGTTMLCAIIKRTTGRDFLQILRPVFDRIGIAEDVYCVEAPVGNGEYIEWGGSGVVMTPRDFARFANLVMHKGLYEGEQILPAEFMEQATTTQIDNGINGFSSDSQRASGYGYQLWMMSHGAFAFLGMGGQYALCVPQKDILLVTTGYEQLRAVDRQVLFDAFWKILWPALSDTQLPPQPSALESLSTLSQSLQLSVQAGEIDQPMAMLISEKTYTMQEGNALGLRTMSFTSHNGEILWQYENATGAHSLRIGLGKNIEQPFPEHYCAVRIDQTMSRGYRSFVSGAWTGEGTLSVQVQIVDIYQAQLMLKIAFRDDTVTVFGEKHAEWFLDAYEGFASGTCK